MRMSKIPKPSSYEKAVAHIAPKLASRIYRTRCAFALTDSWHGASKTRRGVSQYNPSQGDAEADILPYIEDLRYRSRDLVRNDSLAGAAITTKTTSVIGTGLKLQAQPNRDLLKLSDDEAKIWEANTESEFTLWAAGCDYERIQDFYGMQELAFRSVLESGDTLVNTPYRMDPGQAYGTKIQLIEADRISNKNNAPDSKTLSGGVELSMGYPARYHVLRNHPGNSTRGGIQEWDVLEAWGRTGRRRAWLLYHRTRIGQFRGVPDLAPVIESLKQLSRYKEAELMAAVVASLFTVFVKTPEGGSDFSADEISDESGQTSTDKNFKLGNGAIIDLADGEDVVTANPNRPNTAYEGYINAVTAEIGARIEVPVEVLIKRFQSSYSAAKGAFNEAWRYFNSRRGWIANNFCRPMYELFMTEAVSTGRINAPGFLSGDPVVRRAWLDSEWIGDAPGNLDEEKAVKAAKGRIDAGLSNESIETVSLTGRDRDAVYRGRKKEITQRREDNMMLSDISTDKKAETTKTDGEEQ